MKQFVEIQLCHQADCKRWITTDAQSKLILRCPQCYQKWLSAEHSKKMFKKQQLLKTKKQLEEQLNQIYQQNQDKWEKMVESNINQLKLYDTNNKLFALKNSVNTNKKRLSSLQEQLEQFQARVANINKETEALKGQYKQQKILVGFKEQQISKQEHLLKKRRFVIFCQLPFLFDNHLPFQFYRINEEIVETIYDDFIMMSTQSLFSTQLRQSVWKKDVCLTLKKGIEKWEDFFNDNQQYYENFIYSIINVYKLIYYLGKVFDIVLPYIIYIDNHGLPQFLLYEIFSKQSLLNFINFKSSSLTHMQINIYYLKYYVNADLQDKIYSFFDIIDLLQSFYDYLSMNSRNLDHLLEGYCVKGMFDCSKTIRKRKPIPIKLVEVENPKFITQRLDVDELDSDEVEIIN